MGVRGGKGRIRMFTRMRGWQCESVAVKTKSGTGDRMTVTLLRYGSASVQQETENTKNGVNIPEWLDENETDTHVVEALKKENLNEKALLLLSERHKRLRTSDR